MEPVAVIPAAIMIPVPATLGNLLQVVGLFQLIGIWRGRGK